MVIISPILERDEKRQDTLWNTAGKTFFNSCYQDYDVL